MSSIPPDLFFLSFSIPLYTFLVVTVTRILTTSFLKFSLRIKLKFYFTSVETSLKFSFRNSAIFLLPEIPSIVAQVISYYLFYLFPSRMQLRLHLHENLLIYCSEKYSYFFYSFFLIFFYICMTVFGSLNHIQML